MTDRLLKTARQGVTDLHAGLSPGPVLLRLLQAILAEHDRPEESGQKEDA